MSVYTHSNTVASLGDRADNPFFCSQGHPGTYSLSMGTAVPAFPVTNAGNMSTFDVAQLTRVRAGAVYQSAIRIDLGSGAPSVSCLSLVGQVDPDSALQVQSSTDGTTWTTRLGGSSTRIGKDACIARFPAVTARYWRAVLTSAAPGTDTVAYMAVSNPVTLERPFFSGFAPIITPTQIDLHTNVSVGLHFAGSPHTTAGATIEFALDNLTPAFARTTMLPIIQSWNTGHPQFFAWRPQSNPNDSYYIWRDSGGNLVTPSYSGVNDLMNLSFSGRVYYR